MKIISKIIVLEWLRAFIGAMTILLILITVGDIVNGFLRGYNAIYVFTQYILKLPDMLGKIIPICSLLAGLFSLNKLKAQAELMAILASGYSSSRIYKIFLTLALIVGAIQIINLGEIRPFANKIKRQQFEKSRKNESRYIARSRVGSTGRMWYRGKSHFTSFSGFDSSQNLLKNITIYYLDDAHRLKKILKAEKAVFSNNKWQAEGIHIIDQTASIGSYPKLENHKLQPIDLEQGPSDFDQFKSDITTLGFVDLSLFIIGLRELGINPAEFEIMLFEQIGLALVCIVFALLPLVQLRNPGRRSGGFGKNVVFTLVFAVAFWLAHSSLISLGQNGKIPSFVAAMTIPFVFGLFNIHTYYRNRRL